MLKAYFLPKWAGCFTCKQRQKLGFCFPMEISKGLLLSKFWVAFSTGKMKTKIKCCITYTRIHYYMTGREHLLRSWWCFRCCTEHRECNRINCLCSDKSAQNTEFITSPSLQCPIPTLLLIRGKKKRKTS